MPGFANDVSCDDALRPSEADRVEIQVGMLRADMMKDAGDGTADAGVEALHRIDVDGAPNILTLECFTVSCLAKLSPMAMNAFHSSLIK